MADNGFKVETGIKVPSRKGASKGPFALALLALKPGQSLFTKSKNMANVTSYAQHYLGKGKYATRSMDGGARVWRLK